MAMKQNIGSKAYMKATFHHISIYVLALQRRHAERKEGSSYLQIITLTNKKASIILSPCSLLRRKAIRDKKKRLVP